MAIVGKLHKIVFGGVLAQTETWSVGLHFISPDTTIDQPEVIEAAIGQWMSRPTSLFAAAAFLNWIKVNEINPVTGLYVDESGSNTHYVQTTHQGTGAVNAPHITLAVSTVTALTRGYASKGRFFPPLAGGVTYGIDGRIAAQVAADCATSAAQLLTDINGAYTGECVVFSKVGQVVQEITGVRVGRVVDVQSRRRKNLLEDYQAASIS